MSGGADKSAKKAAKLQAQQYERAYQLQQQALQLQQMGIQRQEAASTLGINEARDANVFAQRQFSPYSQAGLKGQEAYLALLGQSGANAQQQAIAGLENTPGYQAQLQTGQRALLQNASATGGLRGGNVQQGLAEFGSGLFGQYYQNQLNRLQELQNLGFNAAGNMAQSRQNAANAMGQFAVTGAQGVANSIGGMSNTLANMGQIPTGAVAKDEGGFNFGGFAGGALKGAGAGAKIGSAVPGIGTGVGAAGGAILGGLGGK